MRSLFHTKLRRPLKILGDDEVQQIHSATLEVLENVGVRFEDEAVLKFLHEQGAHTDPKTHLARIPPSLVEEAIKKCPKRVTLYGRTKNHDLTLGDGKVYFTAGANALQLLDMESGIRRVPTSEDCAGLTRVFDALEHVHAILPAVIPQDVPQTISDRVKHSEVGSDVNCVYEIIVNGLDLERVKAAMRVGIEKARGVRVVRRITAGNYGGKLGSGRIDLRDLVGKQS